MSQTYKKAYHIIYKTTCTITGNWYIGMHSTDNIDDGYLGSGVHLRRSVKKYGKENHRYEILEYLPSRKSLCLREEEILTNIFISDPLCMNMMKGGFGNYPGKPLAEETKAKMSIKLKETWAKRKAEGYVFPVQTEETKSKRALVNTGKKRSEETKERMKAAQAKYLQSVTPEKRAAEHVNRSNAKASKWLVETVNGNIQVTNIKKFALEKELSVSKLYKTLVNGKSYNGYKILEKC